jgi:hypothetical protein
MTIATLISSSFTINIILGVCNVVLGVILLIIIVKLVRRKRDENIRTRR